MTKNFKEITEGINASLAKVRKELPGVTSGFSALLLKLQKMEH